MIDQELLKNAAYACDKEISIESNGVAFDDKMGVEWSPLKDDAQCFRLAIKLGIHFQGHESYPFVVAQYDLNGNSIWIKQEISDNVYATARRAIVRVAAEIGKVKQ